MAVPSICGPDFIRCLYFTFTTIMKCGRDLFTNCQIHWCIEKESSFILLQCIYPMNIFTIINYFSEFFLIWKHCIWLSMWLQHKVHDQKTWCIHRCVFWVCGELVCHWNDNVKQLGSTSNIPGVKSHDIAHVLNWKAIDQFWITFLARSHQFRGQY